MGCKNSNLRHSVNEPLEVIRSLGSPTAVDHANANASAFFKSVLPAADRLLVSAFPPDVAAMVCLSLVNTTIDVARQVFRQKYAHAKESITQIATEGHLVTVEMALTFVEEHSSTDFFMTALLSWFEHNPLASAVVSRECIEAIFESITVPRRLIGTEPWTFASVLRIALDRRIAAPILESVFRQYAGMEVTMAPSRYRAFLTDVQATDVTEKTATERVRLRFGGAVTLSTLALHLNSPNSNCVLDPQRTTNVWQDMTQPLPNYIVHTRVADTVVDVQRALRDGVRALVFHCREVHDEVYGGEEPLASLVAEVRQQAWKENPYPVIIALAPSSPLSLAAQDRIAAILTQTLGDTLAKGIMFDGASLHDPTFSPVALQRKVLVMGVQAPLKPFIGFYVADIQRNGIGVRVTDVQHNTPAEKAGLQRDDWITHINGQSIENKDFLRRVLCGMKLGEEFRLRRENLEEVRVVVGGMVVPNDAQVSKQLSDLIFLKLCTPRSDGHSAPWEAHMMASDELLRPQSPLRRRDLSEHFAFLQLPCTDESDVASVAHDVGVQFVCADHSLSSQRWAKGLFLDNANSGYLMKTDSNAEATEPTVIRMEIVLPPLSVDEGATMTVTCTAYGRSKATVDDGRVIVMSSSSENAVVLVTMTFSTVDKSVSLWSSFPPSLLRCGYRALRLYSDDVWVDRALCRVTRVPP